VCKIGNIEELATGLRPFFVNASAAEANESDIWGRVLEIDKRAIAGAAGPQGQSPSVEAVALFHRVPMARKSGELERQSVAEHQSTILTGDPKEEVEEL